MIYAEFILAFPEFDDFDETEVENALSLSGRLLSESAWGDFYADAIGLDVAHNLTIRRMQVDSDPNKALIAAAGPLSSASAAGASASFGAVGISSTDKGVNWYLKTSYGQRFLALRDQVMCPGMLSI